MLSVQLQDLLRARVRRVEVTGISVSVSLMVETVGHGNDTENVEVMLPHNESRSLRDHAKYVWERALVGKYPSDAEHAQTACQDCHVRP